MELDALAGGVKCIDSHHPILLVEMVKTDKDKFAHGLKMSVIRCSTSGMNFLAIHKDDKCLAHVKMSNPNPP